MPLPVDGVDDVTPDTTVGALTAGENFNFEAKQWQKLNNTDGAGWPQCACWSTGELRAIVPTQPVATVALKFIKVGSE